jgi:NADH pyrophosphatase NudC (nudix superfamily)
VPSPLGYDVAMANTTLFQYCPKLIVISSDHKHVLLARRHKEADYDGVFSFIGGKMITTDESIIAGMKREKDEEIGSDAKLAILPNETNTLLFRKSDGNSMILPHIPAVFKSGEIKLNDEYTEYQWVPVDELDGFEPKIPNITELSRWARQKLSVADIQFVEI